MLLTVDQVIEAAFELSREDRMEILERITDEDFELSEEQKNETRRRIAEHRRDPSTALTREELMIGLIK